MTKYILNSGGLKKQPEKANRFHREIVNGLGRSPRLLFCYFAVPREQWERKFSEHSGRFLQSMEDGVKPSFELAFPDSFEEQVKGSDAVIIYGGDDRLLLYYLRDYELPLIWQGKVVAASSAGSDALARYFWGADWRQAQAGLGLLPIKFIPHYRSEYGQGDPRGPVDWAKAYEELRSYGEDLPISALEEGDYIVIEG